MLVESTQCIYNRNGLCFFLVSAPSECKMCLNFTSADPSLKNSLEVDKPLVTYYDLLTYNPSYKKMFGGRGVQQTLDSFKSSDK